MSSSPKLPTTATRRVREIDIADSLGVSWATVSRGSPAGVQRARIPTVLLTRDVRGAGLRFVAPDEGAIGTPPAPVLRARESCGCGS